MKKALENLSIAQRVTIVMVALLVGGGIYYLVHSQREADFKPLFTGVAPEDAAGIVQKLKESGVEFRLPEGGGSVLVPSGRLAELRLNMAAAGLPKTGRIGFELFDKANLGATEFAEHVNYRRALEGELERSVMSLAEVEQSRVHLTFPKDSVFLEAQQPAKASVLIKVRAGAHMAAQNVLAISHLVASAVEGLAPEAVTVLDMNGNLLSSPKAAGGLDGPEASVAVLDYRHKVESDLLAKINSTLDPLLGANKFRAGVSVECDFSGGEQSEELFDPARSVMTSSQRTEDSSGTAAPAGIPGTPSTLPRSASRPASAGGNRVSRVTENITYQSSRVVKKTRMPAGTVKKMSLALLVDQDLTWQLEKTGYQRVLVPPSPEKLKVIHDMVAGITGFNAERGDQLVVETLPFESTLSIEPPAMPRPPVSGKPPVVQTWPPKWDPKMLPYAVGGGAAAIVLIFLIAMLLRRTKAKATASTARALAASSEASPQPAIATPMDQQFEAKLAERDEQQRKLDEQALSSLKLAPVINKTAEVLARHLREKIKTEPETSAQILRTWINDSD
jgi:flagellar M-ring protein FliF